MELLRKISSKFICIGSNPLKNAEVFYIGGSDTLPPPLKKDEEEALMKKLATYASRCIENEILMYLRKNSNMRSEVSIDEPLNVDWDGNELLLSDILGTDNDVICKNIEDEVDKALLIDAMKKLSVREQQIMRLRFGLGNGKEKTQKEVADMLGISQSYISRLEKRIIGRLKKEIAKMC